MKDEKNENVESRLLYFAVAHEVKTSLLCMSSMLRDMLHSGEYAPEKIAMCERQMTTLADYLKDTSQLMSEFCMRKTEAVNLQEFAELIGNMYRSVAKERNVAFTVQIEQEAYRYLYFDRIMLIHILNNLVTNAVKYSKENGNIVITLDSEALEEYRAAFRVSVKDNGIGMSESFKKRVFEMYTREGRSTSGGNGMGLAIVKKLAECMNGAVSIDTKLGAGTTIVLDFEVDGADECFEKADTDKKNRHKGGSGKQYDFTGRKILVAEDDELFMDWVAETLEKYAMAVDKTYDGLEVTDLFETSENGEYDAVLMDLSMPEMNGVEAARHIRACNRADARTIPILAFTGMPIEDEEAFLLNYQMQAVVPKVFDEAAFVEIFAELFDRMETKHEKA